MPAYGGVSYGGGAYAPLAGNVPVSQLNGSQFPLTYVELAFGSGPLVDPTVWTDLSTWVLSFDINRGRQHELQRFEAGVANIVLNNRDGRFSTFNGSSPYAGQLLPMVQIRIRALWNGLSYILFRGVIESWPTKWLAAADSEIELHCIDLFKSLNLKKAANLSTYPSVILGHSPAHYYRMDDQPGSSTAIDAMGTANGALYTTSAATGETPATFGSDTALVAASSTSLECGTTHGIVTVSAAATSVEMWVKSHVKLPGTFYKARSAVATYSLRILDGSIAGSVQGAVVFSYDDGGHILGLAGYVPVNDGKWHHVVAVVDLAATTLRLYIDGVLDNSLIDPGVTATFPSFAAFGGDPNTFGTGGTPTWNGAIDEAALYSTVLSTSQVASHYVASQLPLTGQTSGQRLASLLAAAAIPSALQAIDTGLSPVQAATNEVTTNTVLANGQVLADTEGGSMFINAAGQVVFYDRLHQYRSPNGTAAVTLGDAAGEEPFMIDSVDLHLDDLDTWNQVVVTPAGQGDQIANDTTSQALYGLRTLSRTTIAAVNAEAAQQASWLVNQYKTPAQRIRSISFTPMSDPNVLFPAAMGFDVLTRITVKRRPLDGSSSIYSQDSLIEGIEHRVSSSGQWTTTWRLSPTDATPVLGIFSDPGPAGMFNVAAFAY